MRTGHKLRCVSKNKAKVANSRQRYFAGGCAAGIRCLHTQQLLKKLTLVATGKFCLHCCPSLCLCLHTQKQQVAPLALVPAAHPPAKYLCLLLSCGQKLKGYLCFWLPLLFTYASKGKSATQLMPGAHPPAKYLCLLLAMQRTGNRGP
jgi:hypothetical protein